MRRTTRVFISSTITSDWDQNYNRRLSACLESAGFLCFLPQRDVSAESARSVFRQNTDAIRRADVVVTVLKNENANLGVEAGFAFGMNKRIVIIRAENDHFPSMLAGMEVEEFPVPSLDSIQDYIEPLIRLLSGERTAGSHFTSPL